MFPLISEYIEAIKSAEDNFDELKHLRPVLNEDDLPIMTSGNFAVVFKMKDKTSGKFYAVKCFTKEQEGRKEAYHQITEELKDVDSPYLVSLRYFDKELFVDTDQTDETEFPVLLMDWVEGKTLDKYLRENLDDKYALEMLVYRFSQLAQWLIPQPFAHGDLKPDNILVREDGSLVLVDYDGMYVPAMKGQKARELGSPDFRHPLRTENDFDEHIDDFPLVSILLSLKAISINPHWLEEYGANDRLLLSEIDYKDIWNCRILSVLGWTQDDELNKITRTFYTYGGRKTIKLDKSFFNIFRPSPLVNRLSYVTIDDWNNKIEKNNGFAYYSNDGKRLLRFFDSIGGSYMGEIWEEFISDYNIENGTEVLCDKSFFGCHNIRYLKIPASIKVIGERAFNDCYLRSIELPNSIEYISTNAFNNCPYLHTIAIPSRRLKNFSELLPSNIYQLKEVNSIHVKTQIESFLIQEKSKGFSYWEALKSLLSSLSYIMRIFQKLEYDFSHYDNKACVRIKDQNVYGINEYNVKDVTSLDEIVDAIYYLLLDINGVDIFDRESYLYERLRKTKYGII